MLWDGQEEEEDEEEGSLHMNVLYYYLTLLYSFGG